MRIRRGVSLLLLGSFVSGCAQAMRPTATSAAVAAQVRALQGRDAQVWLRGGEVLILRAATLECDSVTGVWETTPDGSRRSAAALAEIVGVRPASPSRRDRRRADDVRRAGVVAVGVAAAGVLLILRVLAQPVDSAAEPR
jgi:hypothetical protein